MNSEKKLIRDVEAAEILGCGRSTFWRWVSTGIIPQPIKIGCVSRWYLIEIEALIEKAAVESRAPKPVHPVRTRKRAAA